MIGVLAKSAAAKRAARSLRQIVFTTAKITNVASNPEIHVKTFADILSPIDHPTAYMISW